MEWYKKHRPKKFKDVIGQPDAVKALSVMVENKRVPQALLLMGHTGGGKTTSARILKDELKCGDADYYEIDCPAIDKPLESVREVQETMGSNAWSGDCKVYVFEEIQSWSRARFAQQALLKMLEDTPKKVYFVLTTTDTSKLIKALMGRCTPVRFKSLSRKDLAKIIDSVCEKEQLTLPGDVKDSIIDNAEGSARMALVLLEKAAGLTSEEEQLEAVKGGDSETKAIDLARALIDKRGKWLNIANMLKSLEEEPERVRQLILSYCNSVMLSGGKAADRAYLISCAFEASYVFVCKNDVTKACWEIFHSKE